MSWPPPPACRRVVLAIFGLALALHVSISLLALSAGLSIRASVIVAEVAALLGLSVWVAGRLGLSLQAAFALRRAAKVHWLMAVVAVIPLQVAGGAMQQVILDAWPQMRELLARSMQELTRTDSLADRAMLLLAGVVVAAICEEVLFRGLLLQLLARHSGWTSAILLDGLLFAAFHLEPVGLIPRTAVGVFLGLLVFRSGSLYPAMVAHATFNFTGLFLIPMLPDAVWEQHPVQSGAGATVLFFGLLLLYLQLSRATPPSDRRPTSP
ncbi:MAG: type II CAAX prenyl endopeptidase Rce1 family protein [Acidobacteriota bacterium]